jgi:7-keto-8-aminopelargonate synthetase-like enzyme
MSSSSQIVPILTGSAKDTMEFSQYLFDSGIFVTGIRPPTVPVGKCRLRTTIMANHSEEDLRHSLRMIQDYCNIKKNN